METISPRQALAAEVHNLGISGYAAFSQRLCRFFSAVMPLFLSGYAAFFQRLCRFFIQTIDTKVLILAFQPQIFCKMLSAVLPLQVYI
jgi:hypothetical protein